MTDKQIIIGTKEEIERKIRILRVCIKNDKAKRDRAALENHSQALQIHENQLGRLK